MESTAALTSAAPARKAAHGSHAVPLWGLFLALLVLTAAEVGLYEVWRRTAEQGHPFMPKFALVLLILAFTMPKAVIVAVWFMHLKFEKQIIIGVAIFPFLLAIGGVFTMTSDSMALRPRYDRKVGVLNPVPAHEGAEPAPGGADHTAPAGHGEPSGH